jgi:hypothetical protein
LKLKKSVKIGLTCEIRERESEEEKDETKIIHLKKKKNETNIFKPLSVQFRGFGGFFWRVLGKSFRGLRH